MPRIDPTFPTLTNPICGISKRSEKMPERRVKRSSIMLRVHMPHCVTLSGIYHTRICRYSHFSHQLSKKPGIHVVMNYQSAAIVNGPTSILSRVPSLISTGRSGAISHATKVSGDTVAEPPFIISPDFVRAHPCQAAKNRFRSTTGTTHDNKKMPGGKCRAS